MFEELLKDFRNRINSIIEVSPYSVTLMKFLNISMITMFNKFLEDECKKSEEENDDVTYNIPIEKHHQYKKLKIQSEQTSIALEQLTKSSFINLVAQYDHFFGSLIRCIYIKKPELMNSIEKKVEISDFLTFKNLEEAKENFIDKEIESILRDSHIEQIKYLEKKLNLTLTKDLSIWPKFIEICERRNLLVHCDGIINNNYLNICKKYDCKLDEKEIKSKLKVSGAYLEESCFVILEMGLKLAFVVWNKIEKNTETLIGLANELIYDFIDYEHYAISISLLNFILHEAPFKPTETMRLYLTINLAQSYKWLKKEKELNEVLELHEWDTKAVEYRIAYNVLTENYDLVYEQMKAAKESKIILKHSYLSWPLFKQLRKQDKFIEVFEEIYGEKPKELVNKKKGSSDENTLDYSKSPIPLKLFRNLQLKFSEETDDENS